MPTRSARDAERVLARLDPALLVAPSGLSSHGSTSSGSLGSPSSDRPSHGSSAPGSSAPDLTAPGSSAPGSAAPGSSAPGLASHAERVELLQAILAAAPAPAQIRRSGRLPVRRVVLVSVALVATAAAVTIVRTQPTAVYAATPSMLQYIRTADALPAPALLIKIAFAAERSTTRGRGPYEYIHTMHWTLGSPLLYNREDWSVQPGETQLWLRTDDGSGRMIVRDAHDEQSADNTYGPGKLPGRPLCLAERIAASGQPVDCPIERLADHDTLVRELNLDHRFETVRTSGRVSPLGEAALLASFRVLPPAVRAQLWRILAELPGITYAGRVVDRIGRTGEAFSIDFDGGLGPSVDTIIAEPTTGEILGFERTLKRITDPEFLGSNLPVKIRTPAVIDFWVYVTVERRESLT